jgi:hypothetical protein
LLDVGKTKSEALLPVREAFGMGIAAECGDGAKEFGSGAGHEVVNMVNVVNT